MITNIFKTWWKLYNAVQQSSQHREVLKMARALLFRNRRLWHEYIAHLVRCGHQRGFLGELLQRMRDDPKAAMCIFDFKMKLEPKQFREDQRDYFGKRGFSFHGVAMLYLRKWYYFAHLVSNTSAQDVGMTASITESFLHLLRGIRAFDGIERIVMQSDQARNYTSTNLLCSIAAINRLNWEKRLGMPHVEMLVHSEVQEGHGHCDSFFAVAGAAIRRIIDEGTETLQLRTPADAVRILHEAIQRGTLLNTSAELVIIDVAHTKKVQQELRTGAKLKGTFMVADFGGNEDEFAVKAYRISGDLEYEKLRVPRVESSVASTGDLDGTRSEKPHCDTLPFTRACRSMSMMATVAPAVCAQVGGTDTAARESMAAMSRGRPMDVVSFCTEEGVRKIEAGEIHTITHHNCHRILAGLDIDDGLGKNPCNPEEDDEREMYTAEEDADDDEETEREEELEDGESPELEAEADQSMPRPAIPPDTTVDWDAFLTAKFARGWARRTPGFRSKKTSGKTDDENDVQCQSGPIDPAVREKLLEFFEEGATGGQKVNGGEAIERLVCRHNTPVWALPSVATINAFMSSQNYSRNHRKK